MSEAIESLERHEHAGHIAHGEHAHEEGGLGRGAQWTALLVAFLAAGLAIGEQGARHAELRVQQQAIDAADTWSQYQAKSTRGTIARDVAAIIDVLPAGSDPGPREALRKQLRAEQDAFDHDPKDGKEAIAERAHGLEHARDHSSEQAHAYHNGSASYQLAIVLATASAITRSRPLIYVAAVLGIAGVVFTVLGYFAPELGAI